MEFGYQCRGILNYGRVPYDRFPTNFFLRIFNILLSFCDKIFKGNFLRKYFEERKREKFDEKSLKQKIFRIIRKIGRKTFPFKSKLKKLEKIFL